MKTNFFLVFFVWSRTVQYVISNRYLVSTKSCKIADLPIRIPYDDSSQNSSLYPPVDCGAGKALRSYVLQKEEKYFLRVEKVESKSISTDWTREYKCCYSYVARNGSEKLPDEGVSLSSCVLFETAGVELTEDIVWVWCIEKSKSFYTERKPAYQNVHQIVRINKKLKEKSEKLKEQLGEDRKAISILFIVLDGVSRLNFIRTMPKTKNFTSKNNFYEFRGYNKIADNTYPNFLAWLAGLNKTEIYSVCKPGEIDGLINCPMLWYRFQKLGYITAYAEDWSSLSTFNFFKKGFLHPPTDFYFKPYFDAVSLLETEDIDTMPYCSGSEVQGQRILNLATDFAKITKNLPSFGVFWANTFSHNNRNTTRRMDGQVHQMFEELKENGILDESIVILLSDHGNRYGDFIVTNGSRTLEPAKKYDFINFALGTGRGFLEERLPMNYISLPPWFKEKYPQETEIFKQNSKKLTSTFDLYMTLQHLLVLSGLNVTVEHSRACESCQSWFEQLPEDRTCEHAGIPKEWRSCIGLIHKQRISAEEEKTIKHFIQTKVITQIRENLKDPTKVLNVQDLLEVVKSEPNLDDDSLVIKYYYLVKFSTLERETYQVVFTKLTGEISKPKIVHIRAVLW